MKSYQYQHSEGRITDKRFSSDALALKFLELLGHRWQLVTPICDVQPMPPAGITPEGITEVELLLQASLEKLQGIESEKVVEVASLIQYALYKLHPITHGWEVQEPTVPYGQPDANGHNQAAADYGFSS
ncbi:hypothetical protein SAMN06265337_0655 [Hymenobacter gelipurpurascens]|uniref:Uncharacterized protein n=1 Tax=Hymenobacter gelipurpurascens TaxID=89968 RepID=A0A212T8M0_9BACT|nr:hypothetical protein [Hymenobacter gelipurpurascens]SNC62365.1 hypothetical protein SAMN06265337_0655 [Hymenobacter gelipurpurascens]